MNTQMIVSRPPRMTFLTGPGVCRNRIIVLLLQGSTQNLRLYQVGGSYKSGVALASHSSGGNSKSIKFPRNPRVLIAPKMIPAAIQIVPTILAGRLRFSQSSRQMKNPASGGKKFENRFLLSRTK